LQQRAQGNQIIKNLAIFFYVLGPLDIYSPLDNQWIGTNFMGRQRVVAWGVYPQGFNLMSLHL